MEAKDNSSGTTRIDSQIKKLMPKQQNEFATRHLTTRPNNKIKSIILQNNNPLGNNNGSGFDFSLNFDTQSKSSMNFFINEDERQEFEEKI